MFEESSFRKLIEIMNRHVPSRRRSLADLLEEGDAQYQGKDGVHYRIKRKELELLASMLDESEKQRLKLPIIIMTDTSYGEGGAWKVMGKLEVKVISRIIEREPESPEEIRIFHPHMVMIRKALPTATTTLYAP
jgi:uncharacterized protein (UPF0216 family)